MATRLHYTPDKFLHEVVEPAWKRAIAELNTAFDAAIVSVIYDWDRPTRRKNKTTVSSPRDIVDTGEFVRSREIVTLALLQTLVVWRVEYASRILLGFRRKDGSSAPPRDWITEGLRDYDLRGNLQAEINRNLR